MAFLYMNYAFITLFFVFRIEIVSFYHAQKTSKKRSFILFACCEFFLLILFLIQFFKNDTGFYSWDLIITLIPALIVSQTLNLFLSTKKNELTVQKLFFSFHSLVICTISFLYFTGLYQYIGKMYYEWNAVNIDFKLPKIVGVSISMLQLRRRFYFEVFGRGS